MVRRAEYIRFEHATNVPPRMKTSVVEVRSVSSDKLLGVIHWYTNWRQYVFSPEPMTLFNPDCMEQISERVKRMTAEHRQLLRMRRRENQD